MFSSVLTLANSIIGVSILAMPYCFKQCGVILATVMILLSGMLVKLACHLLIKSAMIARRRNFEYLAFHTFSGTGKFLVELGIIGYLAGTAIAFFVVMGDLGPPLVADLGGVEQTANLRLVILAGLGVFVALPLSLLKDIESLQIVCTSSIMFYICVVARVVFEARTHLLSGEWMGSVNLWRPAGMLQCFPIFSMALSCQTNLFEVYNGMPDGAPYKMNEVVRGAVNLCTTIYIIIGFFGYVAFYDVDFGGNILTIFSTSYILKLGFVISVAMSFPLVIFPCRTSIHSLMFRKTYQGIGSTELVTDYIPPARFNMITICVIAITLTIGILIPDIELVLGLVGSTMGSSICVIFPAAVFLKLVNKNTTERIAAQGVLVIGIITLILGTYVNLTERPTSADPKAVIKGLQDNANIIPPAGFNVETKDVAGKLDEAVAAAGNNVANLSKLAAQDEGGGKKSKSKTLDEEKLQNLGKAVMDSIGGDKSGKGKDKGGKDGGEVEKDAVRQEPANPVPPADSEQQEDNVKSLEREETNLREKKDFPRMDDDKPEVVEDSGKVAAEDTKQGADEDTENDKKSEKDLDAGELLEELAKHKEEQIKILAQQKEILDQLKQHQQSDQDSHVPKEGAQPEQPVAEGSYTKPEGHNALNPAAGGQVSQQSAGYQPQQQGLAQGDTGFNDNLPAHGPSVGGQPAPAAPVNGQTAAGAQMAPAAALSGQAAPRVAVGGQVDPMAYPLGQGNVDGRLDSLGGMGNQAAIVAGIGIQSAPNVPAGNQAGSVGAVGVQQAPVGAVVVQQAPIAAAVGQQAPIAAAVGQQAPIPAAVGQQAPIAAAVGQQAPIVAAVGQQAPIAPAVGQQVPIAAAVGQQAPIAAAVGQQAQMAAVGGQQAQMASVVGQQAAVGGQAPMAPAGIQQAPIAAGVAQPAQDVAVGAQQGPMANAGAQQFPMAAAGSQVGVGNAPNNVGAISSSNQSRTVGNSVDNQAVNPQQNHQQMAIGADKVINNNPAPIQPSYGNAQLGAAPLSNQMPRVGSQQIVVNNGGFHVGEPDGSLDEGLQNYGVKIPNKPGGFAQQNNRPFDPLLNEQQGVDSQMMGVLPAAGGGNFNAGRVPDAMSANIVNNGQPGNPAAASNILANDNPADILQKQSLLASQGEVVKGRDLKEQETGKGSLEAHDSAAAAVQDDSWEVADSLGNGQGKREDRMKRDLCENDPLCADKFNRNPLTDSDLDVRVDFGRLLRVGEAPQRALLAAVAGDADVDGGYGNDYEDGEDVSVSRRSAAGVAGNMSSNLEGGDRGSILGEQSRARGLF